MSQALSNVFKLHDVINVKDPQFAGGVKANGVTDDSAAWAAVLSAAPGRSVVFPGGSSLVKTPLSWPDFTEIIFMGNAEILYDDTASPGSYCLTFGGDGPRRHGLKSQGLRIILQTDTACGLDMLNSISGHLVNTYIERPVPANIVSLTNPQKEALMTGRTNIGIRVRTSGSTDSFWNTFDRLNIQHLHTGVSLPGAGTVTFKQFFNDVTMFGDALYGDKQSVGFLIQRGGFSTIKNGYFESYDDHAINGAAALKFEGSGAGHWSVSGITFESSTDLFNLKGGGASAQIPMTAAAMNSISAVFPKGIHIEDDCRYIGNVSVANNANASHGNYIGDRPNGLGEPWTATMTPSGSGTITLNSGAGGDLCYSTRRGRNVRVWGNLSVASVNSPIGRLLVSGLPYPLNSSGANTGGIALHATGFDASVTYPIQGNPAATTFTNFEISGFSAGVKTTDLASKVKAGTSIFFEFSYSADDIA